MKPKILIVDDDICILESFQIYFKNISAELVLSSSHEEAVAVFREAPHRYACVFVDYRLVNEFGEQEAVGHKVAEKLKEINPSVYVVMMSGDDSKEALNTWLSSGMEQFIYKPLREELIQAFVEHALGRFWEQFPQMDKKLFEHYGFIGVSEHVRRIIRLTEKFAPLDETVLVSGETGTGKELVVNALYKQSKRAGKPFVAINCAALTETLFESELFGHVKGAFTGADANKLGKFREAAGGTLFLDEIHRLSIAQQAKILRVIQERVVTPVGGKQDYYVDFRLICAGKPNLRKHAIDNKFLIDLFFRISSLNIEISPLRERPEDIIALVRFFQKMMEEKLGMFKYFSLSVLKKFQEYSWPGNVRELEKMIRELYFVVDRNTINDSDLPRILQGEATGEMTMADLEERHREQKRLLIKSTMKRAKNNKTQAAKLLGMKRSTFIWLMQELGD